MTTVTTCSNPAEAMLLKSVLEANNIPTYVPEELTAQSAVNFAGSGIRVQVDDENIETAKRVLADTQKAFAAQDDGDDEDETDDDASADAR